VDELGSFHIYCRLGNLAVDGQSKTRRLIHRADTLIYGIFIYDRDFKGTRGLGYNDTQDKQNLRWRSSETGGAYFEVTKKATLGLIYGKIEEQLRSQYNLGYVPDDQAQNGYRKVEVGVQKKGLVVRGRRGYFSNIRKTKTAGRSR
jgi:VWFA-related protein